MGHGRPWLGMARSGWAGAVSKKTFLISGKPRHGWSWRGLAGQGLVGYGAVWVVSKEFSILNVARPGAVRRGMARLGPAGRWLGGAWLGRGCI